MDQVTAATEKLADMLADADRVCVFTGAGISTESGIADFRSPGGIWSRIKPIPFQRFVEDEEARLEDWRRRFHFKAQYEAAQPNAGHYAVAKILSARPRSVVVTQNIDGLHQRAGVADNSVIELHGSGLKASCLDCGAPMALDAARDHLETQGVAPRCGRCGGIVKADVISFGQPMPQTKLRAALESASACDMALVLGSSLVVQPAAKVPEVAAKSGAGLVVVNNEPTPLDRLATLVIRAPIGEVLQRATAWATA